MRRFAYLSLSTAVFIAVVALHVVSYRLDVPAWVLQSATALALLLCVPLVLLFIQIKKQARGADAWQRFWQAALERCPRWVWGSISIAVLLMWATGALNAFFDLPRAAFQTAALLIPAAVSLSYAVTLWHSDDETA